MISQVNSTSSKKLVINILMEALNQVVVVLDKIETQKPSKSTFCFFSMQVPQNEAFRQFFFYSFRGESQQRELWYQEPVKTIYSFCF